jgi:PKD repeat protein
MLLSAGRPRSDSETDPINQPPTNRIPHANIKISSKVHINEEIQFSAENSYDEDGSIVSYHWNFGDGITAKGEVVSHTYTALGSYQVTLTVTDDEGARSNKTMQVSVTNNKDLSSNDGEGANAIFWVIAGGLSALLLVGIVLLNSRRRFFE